MARPLHWLDSIHNFPVEIEDTVQHLALARREFLTTGLPPSQSVRSVIRESWQRCAPRIEPERAQVPVNIATDADLRELRIAHEPFLRAAAPVVTRLNDFLAGSGYIIGLANPQGRLLQVCGDKAPVGWLEQIGLAPGGDWSEATAGTNGIGTALAVGRPVRVLGPEHLCDGWQDITCITVPIRDPRHDECAGVLDISGDYHLMRPFFAGILTAAALEIRQNLNDLLRPRSERSTPFHIAILGFSGNVANQPWSAAAASRPAALDALALRTQLDYQERRAWAAERLALASGAVSACLDLNMTLERVAEQAAHLLELDNSAACVFDESGEGVAIRAYTRSQPQPVEPLRVMQAVLNQAALINALRDSGEPILIDDVRTARQLSDRSIEQRGVRALALLPLPGAQQVIGFILAPRAAPYRWRAEDLNLGLTFALHAAGAIENARLFELLQQHHQRVQELNAVNQLLYTVFDPAQHLDLIVERIASILRFEVGAIVVRQLPGDSPALAAHFGLPESALPDLWAMMADHTAAGAALLICGLLPGDDATGRWLRATGLCDLMIAPLAAGGEVMGSLLLGSHPHRKLTEEDLTFFTSIGQQLGLALKNAQLLRAVGEAEATRETDRIKRRFLMTVSHDLRSPLTAIRTSVESLLEQVGDRSTDNDLLDNIAGQAKRLGRLVDKLLDLSRIEAGALKLDRDWLELSGLIADTVAKFDRLNGPGHIDQQLAADLPLIYVDPDRIVQVLWNLLENAHKYAPAASPVTVVAAWTQAEVLIEVADRGPGIPLDERDKIFQYFYRLNRDQQHTPGTGLGLAICHGIVEAHGGRIWLEDRSGGGSRFCVALPYPAVDPASLEALADYELRAA
jgi:signal transduction histidine kinase